MSENRGTNSESQATVALPAQSTPEQLALDLTTAPVAPAPREGEPSGFVESGDVAGRRVLDSSTSGADEGLTDEITDLTPLIAASPTTSVAAASILAAHAAPAALTVATPGRAWRTLVAAVGDLLEHRDGIWALEAGAGTRPLFDLPEDAFIVGVDRDPRALDSNVRLDQRISVELDEFRPVAAGFDLISSWYVLDNLEDPAPVLDRFAQWAGEDGLIVLAVPNLRSPRGVLVRLTGRARLRRSLTPRAMRRRFSDRGFTPVFQVYFEDADQAALRHRFKITHGWWKAVQALVRVLTLGTLDAARTDYVVVFRRDRDVTGPGAPPTP